MSYQILRRAGIAGVLPLVLSVGAGRPPLTPIAGTFTMKYADAHPIPVGDAEGHVLLITRSTGLNRNTGPSDYMADAEVVNVEIADLAQGNGPHQGYVTFAQGRNTTVVRWSGTVATTLGADRQPVTTFRGRWMLVRGTGRYAGASGSGGYQGRLLSKDDYEVKWEGRLDLKEVRAERSSGPWWLRAT